MSKKALSAVVATPQRNQPAAGVAAKVSALDAAEALWLWRQMFLIRAFEERLLALKEENLVHGPVHASVGQEAVAAGVATALRPIDKVSGSHRAHHHYLAKALNACRTPGAAADAPFNEATRGQIRTLFHEILGLREGCSGGRGGSMHLYAPEIGVVGTNAIVAGGVAMAAGVAWADRMLRRDAVTVAFYGDGAVYQGVVHETCNLAALWKAPVIFAIENNEYAVATCATAACSAKKLYDTAHAYGMAGHTVDGMDAEAVCAAVRALRADPSKLPCILELHTYRHYHHAGKTPGSAYGYRSKDEEARWHGRDPVVTLEERLRAGGAISIDTLKAEIESCLAAAVESCIETTASGKRAVREAAWPATESAEVGLRDPLPVEVLESTAPRTRALKYSDAIAEVTGRWLEKDPKVVVIGEEVANFGGGAYGATKGLPQKFPDRVLNTPITENGFSGMAAGAAMNGLHPVVELMFSSFGLVAADQLFNQAGQVAHIYGGRPTVPMVVRTRIGAGLGYGAQHSMEPVGLFSQFPGWRIIAPTTPYDYIGLFNSAMRLKSPTLIVEHQGYYATRGDVPEGPADHLVPLGKAAVRRPGTQATVVAYGWGVELALQAATLLEKQGLAPEVIDLRTLDDASMDVATIGESLRKTNVLVTVEEAMGCNGLGAKIIAACQARFFDYFDAPGTAITAKNIPLPVSKRLETYCLPAVPDIAQTISDAIRRKL